MGGNEGMVTTEESGKNIRSEKLSKPLRKKNNLSVGRGEGNQKIVGPRFKRKEEEIEVGKGEEDPGYWLWHPKWEARGRHSVDPGYGGGEDRKNSGTTGEVDTDSKYVDPRMGDQLGTATLDTPRLESETPVTPTLDSGQQSTQFLTEIK